MSELVETVRWRSLVVKELTATIAAAREDPRFGGDAIRDLEEGLRRANAKIRALGGVVKMYEKDSTDDA